MSKRKAKRNVPPGKQADTPPPRHRRQTLGPGAALMLGPTSPEAGADDSQFWGQTILNEYRRVTLRPDPDTSPGVSVFRALNQRKRFSRFRALCEAVGLGPGEGIGEADVADWWLRVLLMPQESHDDLWRLFPESLAALRMASAEVATRMALVAEAAITTARRKKDIIISQADQIADLHKQLKATSKRRRPPYETKIRPLTNRQTEAMEIVPECKGNFSEAGRRLKLDPKTVRQHYWAGLKKLGSTAVSAARAARQKPKTQPLPEDRRGQTDLYKDADGKIRQGRHLHRRRRSGKRHDQG